MSALIDVFINGLLNQFGSATIVALFLLFIGFLIFLAVRLPTFAASCLVVGFGISLVQTGWLPIWVKAILLMIDGFILYIIIMKISRG